MQPRSGQSAACRQASCSTHSPIRADEAGLLGQRYERFRRDVAPQRVMPAEQRFRSNDLPPGQIQLRLIVQAELVLADRFEDVGLQRPPLQQFLVHVGRKEPVDASALLLGAIQGHIGLLQQDSRIDVGQHDIGRAPQRNADADTDDDLVAVQVEARIQRIDQALCQHLGIRKLPCADLHDGEFVAAEPRQRVGLANTGAQPAGHADQQPVAGGVAQRVVHLLEAVEIEVEHGQRRALAPRPGHRLLEPITKQRAVGQSGQRVMRCQMRRSRQRTTQQSQRPGAQHSEGGCPEGTGQRPL